MNKLIAFLLMLSAFAGHAQYRQPFFNRLTVANGLPEGFVVASLQDRQEYIWMGTQNGLVRYDGYSLKAYDMLDDNAFTTKPTGSGTGLGLSLSYDIIKAHGGEIKVESKEGEGTMFTVQLPVIN